VLLCGNRYQKEPGSLFLTRPSYRPCRTVKTDVSELTSVARDIHDEHVQPKRHAKPELRDRVGSAHKKRHDPKDVPFPLFHLPCFEFVLTRLVEFGGSKRFEVD
jgi:hypothetical protein